MTREELNELNALVAENDAITLALSNLEAGGLLCSAGVGPNAEYAAPVPLMGMPTPPMGMAMPASVPIRGDVPASLMTELQAYLTSRQGAVQADLAARGGTPTGASAQQAAAPQRQAPPQRPAAPPLQRPAPPQR